MGILVRNQITKNKRNSDTNKQVIIYILINIFYSCIFLTKFAFQFIEPGNSLLAKTHYETTNICSYILPVIFFVVYGFNWNPKKSTTIHLIATNNLLDS